MNLNDSDVPTWPPTPPPIRGTVPAISKWDVYEDSVKATTKIMSKNKKTQEDWQKIDEIMKQWAKETFQFEPVSTEPFNKFNDETQTTQPVEQLENMLLDTLDSLAAKYQNESTAFSEGAVISRI